MMLERFDVVDVRPWHHPTFRLVRPERIGTQRMPALEPYRVFLPAGAAPKAFRWLMLSPCIVQLGLLLLAAVWSMDWWAMWHL